MPRTSRIKPVSYFKAHASRLIRELNEVGEPLVLTQRGYAKAVVQDVVSYEKTQQTLALLKILALADKNVSDCKTVPAKAAIKRVRQRLTKVVA